MALCRPSHLHPCGCEIGQVCTSSPLPMCDPLTSQNSLCYIIPTLVDRVLTSTLPALRPVLPVRRCIRANELYLVFTYQRSVVFYGSVSVWYSAPCFAVFRQRIKVLDVEDWVLNQEDRSVLKHIDLIGWFDTFEEDMVTDIELKRIGV